MCQPRPSAFQCSATMNSVTLPSLTVGMTAPSAPHMTFGASVVIDPSWSFAGRGGRRCGESRLFSPMIRSTRLRPTRMPSITRSRAQTLRCPSPAHGERARSWRMPASRSCRRCAAVSDRVDRQGSAVAVPAGAARRRMRIARRPRSRRPASRHTAGRVAGEVAAAISATSCAPKGRASPAAPATAPSPCSTRRRIYDARRSDEHGGHAERSVQSPAGRRGPKPAVSDGELLAAIHRDLARSPWAGEGHRKVWARLRVIDGIRVSRSRVLRIMGENSLLSPHRRPPRPANDHDGSITTEAPNVMWGADGAVIPTVNDGNVTLFIVAEHWNAEGLGWHVAKHGNRYAAAEALALAVSQVFGSVRADAARGVLVRHDHGSR